VGRKRGRKRHPCFVFLNNYKVLGRKRDECFFPTRDHREGPDDAAG